MWSANLTDETPRAYRALAAAALIRALRDAAGDCRDLGPRYRKHAQEDATAWLAGPESAALCEALGLDVDTMREKIGQKVDLQVRGGYR